MNYLKAKISTPVNFVGCGHFIAEENWTHMKRTNDNFEIIIGIKGSAFIQQDNEKYEVTPGKVLLLLPGHIHQGYYPSNAGTSFYWLHFLCKDEYSILQEKDALMELSPLPASPYFSKVKESIALPAFFTLENIEKIIIQFRQLLHITQSNYYSKLASDYLTTLLLIELTQEVIDLNFNALEGKNIHDKKFISILQWIRMNLNKDFSVKEIAFKFNFNEDYLTRLFKKYLGVSTLKYINGMRVARSKELLTKSEESIKEIAYLCGFKSEKYFMKLFKEYENLTPTEFRNAYYRTYLNNI
ncbi:helix-turn-helix transcriptional regulator [Clostridium sp. 19966]|uniref:AraC family transcriptional regulator n=1 Tax=Clostridium sp. 19966 TaxID=2768166 RepID=UPI0028DF0F47|nr:AraC family transcriptional regulator [Clostridium sp. 19966]MDT8715114.1 helix-turn-helix transcriptional regulator [Clostridium sp. 19966]